MSLKKVVRVLAPVFSRYATVADYDMLEIQQARDACVENPSLAKQVMATFHLVSLEGFYHAIQRAFDDYHDALERIERKKVRELFQGY